MKHKTTSLLAICILALVTSTSTVYAKTLVNPQPAKNLYGKVKIAKKVIISGNVEVTLVQDAESKKLYVNNGTAKVNVYTKDNSIYVSTKKNSETAKITLYVDHISRIDVEGNATVMTKNTLNLQYLQIILRDKAKADISSNTESLYTKLVNESSLKLSGNTEELTISTNELAHLNTNGFKAVKTEIEKRIFHYTKAK